MTPIRRKVLVASLLGMLLFGLAFFWIASFYLQLVLFFFFFLSLFHAGLSAWVSITKRQARASDYFYFSAAAVGLFMASLAGAQDREEYYYAAIASTVGRPDVRQLASSSEELTGWCEKIPWPNTIAGTISRWFYGDRLDTDTCAFAKRVSELITQQNYSEVPNLLKIEGERHAFRLEPFWLRGTPLIIWYRPLKQIIGDILYWQIKLPLEASYYYTDAYKTAREGGAEEHYLQIAVSRYLYSALWPFLLALAISLRITRVTADVSDWPL
jgi:hypothetical protein